MASEVLRDLEMRKAELLMQLGEVEWEISQARKQSLTENYESFEQENFN